MATTTTNYGFDVPTSSDLVKNGATAISTLGQDIDTFLFRPLAKNCTYNSAFDIWQRGTSFTANGYTADRWYAVTAGIAGRTISRVAGTGQFQYMTRIQRTAGNTATNGVDFGQSFEIADATLWAGKTVTFSFYARKGADFSGGSSTMNTYVFSGTSSTETNRVTTAYPSGGATAGSGAVTLTTTLQRFQYTFTFGATVTQFAFVFSLGFTGTAGTNDYVEITGIQLEESTQASPFCRQTGTIQGELAACQRYYYRWTPGSVYSQCCLVTSRGTTNADGLVPLPVVMRIAPTTIDYSTLLLATYPGGSSQAVTAIVLNSASPVCGGFTTTVASTIGTGGQALQLLSNNSTNAYIGFSAEL